MFFLRCFLLGVLCLVGSACLPNDKEKKQKGSVNAVSICIEKNQKQSDLVSKDLIKNQCILKHEQYKKHSYTGGHLASVNVNRNAINIDITNFKNTFRNFVITSIHLEGNYRDSEGVKTSVTQWVTGLWLEPNATSTPYVSIPLPEESAENISISCVDIAEKKNCKGWRVLGYRGLEIKLN